MSSSASYLVRRIVIGVIAVSVGAGCGNEEAPATANDFEAPEQAQESAIELDSPDEACRTVARVNESMASGDAAERSRGEAVAATVWERASQDDQLADWLRRSCGAASLQMAYDAGLRVNGSVPDD